MYGYALVSTDDDCTKCPCPKEDAECVEMLNGDGVCINCKEGYTGRKIILERSFHQILDLENLNFIARINFLIC